MSNPGFSTVSALRSLFTVTALVAVSLAHGQNINVTAANASNDAIYSVVFNAKGGGTTTVLNTDGGSLHHLTSLVFLTNPATFQLDLLAADNQGGVIVRYPGDFQFGNQSFGTPIPMGGTGPANPDGLSVDPAGDLFVVNSKPGASSNPQLWELPNAPGGNFGTPVPLDSNYGSSEVLQETLVVLTAAPSAAPVVNPGDLLVLTSNPNTVLLYPGAKAGNAQNAQPCTQAPQTIPCILVTVPSGTTPGGMAFWPPDNRLLVTTSKGTIYQYQQLTSTEMPLPFVSGLGNGQFKIKTGIQFGSPFAYVANNNGGDIIEFGLLSGVVTQLATVTSGVQHPQGLAVTNVAYAPVTACQPSPQNPSGCDLLGNEKANQRVLLHNVPANLTLNGNVVENVCVVNTDPRPLNAQGQCPPSLPVNQVCPGFDNTPAGALVIPQTLCGASGPTGHGFALAQTLTQAYSLTGTPFNGSLIYTDSNVDNVLAPPAAGNPLCNPLTGTGPAPLGTLAWAPLNGEGLDPEVGNLVDITNGCDNSGGRGSGLSLYAIGLALSTSDLVTYTVNKYQTLTNTVSNEVAELVLTSPSPFTQQLQQCISTSQTIFNLGNRSYYGGAAVELLAADQQVAAVAGMSPPFNPPGPHGDYPNPSGTVRMLLDNLYYTIMTRLLYFNAGTSGPPSPTPAPQLPPPPPMISGTPATSAKVGTLYSFQPTAADFTGTNHGTLTFSIAAPPGLLAPAGWATFNTTTGLLSGVPGKAAAKTTYSGIVITVSDGCASAPLKSFSIKVTG